MRSSQIFNHLALAASRRAVFLGNLLDRYAKRECLSSEDLAERLRCSSLTLDRLRLCRAPQSDEATFAHNVKRIAERFNIPTTGLLAILRDLAASYAMATDSKATEGYLMAARDRDEKDDDAE